MSDSVEVALRAAYRPALASLVRMLRSLDMAEEAIQESAIAALKSWSIKGVPDSPVAWLVRAGRNAAIDRMRRSHREADLAEWQEPAGETPDLGDEALRAQYRDDQLRLMFTCCHPALDRDAQVALTLKTIAGIRTEEIARAFLVASRTMEKRLGRASQRLKQAEASFEAPPAAQWPERLDAVRSVLYLIFNQGYSAPESADAQLLVCQALRLATLLVRVHREDGESLGLIGLMRLHHARRAARVDELGRLVALDEQDQALWDRAEIELGKALVEKALRYQPVGPYALQAAIAALHATAPSFDQTDWAQIAVLYQHLMRLGPNPVYALNHASAIGFAQGPERALALLKDLASEPSLVHYAAFHAARAGFLKRAGDLAGARQAYQKARDCAATDGERAHLERQMATLRPN